MASALLQVLVGIFHDEIGDVKRQPSDSSESRQFFCRAEPVFWNRKDALCVKVKVVFPH